MIYVETFYIRISTSKRGAVTISNRMGRSAPRNNSVIASCIGVQNKIRCYRARSRNYLIPSRRVYKSISGYRLFLLYFIELFGSILRSSYSVFINCLFFYAQYTILLNFSIRNVIFSTNRPDSISSRSASCESALCINSMRFGGRMIIMNFFYLYATMRRERHHSSIARIVFHLRSDFLSRSGQQTNSSTFVTTCSTVSLKKLPSFIV